MKYKYLLACGLMLVALAGCNGDNNENNPNVDPNINQNDNSSSQTENFKADYSSEFKAANKKMVETTPYIGQVYIKDEAMKVVEPWLNLVYGEGTISNIEIDENIPTYANRIFMKDINVSIPFYKVSFNSTNELKHLPVDENGKYTSHLVGVFDENAYDHNVFIGLWDYDAIVNLDVKEILHNICKDDSRYSAYITEIPSPTIPDNGNEISFKNVVGGRYVTNSSVVDNNVVALIVQDNPIWSNFVEKPEYEIFLYDIGKDKIINSKKINSYDFVYFSKENNKTYVNYRLEDFYKMELTKKGFGKEKEIEYENQNAVFSPSGKLMVYSDFSKDGSLVLVDEKGQEKVLLSGYRDVKDEANNKYISPAYWYNENEIIYVKYGYEWAEAIGIYNIKEGKYTQFQTPEFEANPLLLSGDMLYVCKMDGSGISDVGRINLASEHYDYSETGLRGFVTGGMTAFSEDGSLMASILFNPNSLFSEAEVVVYQVSTGDVIGKYVISETDSYLGDISFIDNHTLYINSYSSYLNQGKAITIYF